MCDIKFSKYFDEAKINKCDNGIYYIHTLKIEIERF
jgi:hypothetical protein